MPEQLAEWALLGGVFLSILIGLAPSLLGSYLLFALGMLVLLGLVVGLLKIRVRRPNAFLITIIILLKVSDSFVYFQGLMTTIAGPVGAVISSYLESVLGSLTTFLSPAAFIVALRSIYNLAKRR